MVCSNFLAIEDSSLRMAVAEGSLVDEGFGSTDHTRQEPEKVHNTAKYIISAEWFGSKGQFRIHRFNSIECIN